MQLQSAKESKLLMESLPDEIWLKIFEIGIENTNYSLKDISSLLICCKLFNRLWEEDTLWSLMLTLDFPQHESDDSADARAYSSCKNLLYKYSLAKYCKTEFCYFERQFDKIRSRISGLTDSMDRVRAKIKRGSERLERLTQKWHREVDRGKQIISLMSQAPFPSIDRTTIPITASSTAPPISDPSAASLASAQSSSTTADHIFFLVDLKTKIDEVLSYQKDKISRYGRQRAQISALFCMQRDHYTQLETLTSCLVALSSGCNPINVLELEVDDIDDEDDDYDDDVEQEDDFDIGYVEDDIDGLPAERD